MIREPHAYSLLRADIWHIRGAERDLVIDTGLGVAALRPAFPELFDRDPILVVTHAHLDHMGSAHEFEDCWAHPLESLDDPVAGTLESDALVRALGLGPHVAGEHLPELLISAIPSADYDPSRYRLRPARVTRHLTDGDLIDLGERALRVLHLPGHSPGSTVYEEKTGTLFSGDVIYDGELFDGMTGSDVGDYVESMLRLHSLPVQVVHPGHDAGFDGFRMREIIARYLESRQVRRPK